MSHVEKAVEVERPADTVWPHLRLLPAVLDGVRDAETHADGRVLLTGEDGARWEAALVEETAPDRVVWRDLDGTAGTWGASLIALSPRRTRVDLVVDHDASGLVERAADALGRLDRRVEATLARLRTAVEDAVPPPWD